MTSLVEHSDVQLTEYRCLLKTCYGLSNKSLKGFLNIEVITNIDTGGPLIIPFLRLLKKHNGIYFLLMEFL